MDLSHQIITPIIHLNGDRRETLLANIEHAYEAVQNAIEALQRCAPNGRNFYPVPGRFEKAEAQHWTRMEHLGSVLTSLKAEAIQIQDESRSY